MLIKTFTAEGWVVNWSAPAWLQTGRLFNLVHLIFFSPRMGIELVTNSQNPGAVS